MSMYAKDSVHEARFFFAKYWEPHDDLWWSEHRIFNQT